MADEIRKRVGRRVYRRGGNTVELPYLMSCCVFLLDRRHEIVGVRFPFGGSRFDVVAKSASGIVLVEAKYRADGRPVRPYEVEKFQSVLERAKKESGREVVGVFICNCRFSSYALELGENYGIKMVSHVPLLFRLFSEETEREREKKGEAGQGYQL